MRWLPLFLLMWPLVSSAAAALSPGEEVYQPPEDFLAESFDGVVPGPSVLWLTPALRDEARRVLGHDFGALRVRYWADAQRSAWVLEEIGKVKPITTGLVVADGRIERIKVLIYRESHGWEVKHPFFTNRFRGAGLTAEDELDQPIDNISGATLSVNALKRLAALALVFDEAVRGEGSE